MAGYFLVEQNHERGEIVQDLRRLSDDTYAATVTGQTIDQLLERVRSLSPMMTDDEDEIFLMIQFNRRGRVRYADPIHTGVQADATLCEIAYRNGASFGDIDGCYRCNSLIHTIDNCPVQPPYDDFTTYHYEVVNRVGRPPLRSARGWNQLAVAMNHQTPGPISRERTATVDPAHFHQWNYAMSAAEQQDLLIATSYRGIHVLRDSGTWLAIERRTHSGEKIKAKLFPAPGQTQQTPITRMEQFVPNAGQHEADVNRDVYRCRKGSSSLMSSLKSKGIRSSSSMLSSRIPAPTSLPIRPLTNLGKILRRQTVSSTQN
ncbi:hypothetical protein F4811DRAFT_569507 [Daldinia bambusicola]|nr:hypothetical protein F4811DRAFT_569507 [Daldinia bambusicola]